MSNTVRYIARSLACVGLFIVILAIVIQIAQSVELSIVGHVLGHGIQALNYSGDSLNVSIYQNGTFFIDGSA